MTVAKYFSRGVFRFSVSLTLLDSHVLLGRHGVKKRQTPEFTSVKNIKSGYV